jgi:hypothetical protein
MEMESNIVSVNYGGVGGTTNVIEGKPLEESNIRKIMVSAIAIISALCMRHHNTDSFQLIIQVIRYTKHEYCYKLVISNGTDSITVQGIFRSYKAAQAVPPSITDIERATLAMKNENPAAPP